MSFSTPGNGDSHPAIDLADYRAELHAWLDANHEQLAPRYRPPGTIDDRVAQMQRVKSILFDAGWMQRGWPERVGGSGGSPMMRTELGAALAARDFVDSGLFTLIEVLAPTLGRSPEQLRERLLVGPAGECVEKLARYEAAGAGRVLLWPVGDALRQLERFHDAVRSQLGTR
jgi:alkylation response protein AidB-like acyl-CoA dehydrogenase